MNSNLLENRIGCYATDAGKFFKKKGGPSRKATSVQALRVGPPVRLQAFKLDRGSGIL